MKRFWVIMLSLGLIAAFSTTVLALDVKFSGEFYAAGMYLDKTTVKKDTATDGPSTAFYFQRLRLRTDFIVSPGLTLVTRMDMMERSWGATRSTVPLTSTYDTDSSGTRAENENIAIDWAYIHYESPIGIFDVGIMNDGATGTIFSNSYAPLGRIKYSNIFGPVVIVADITKSKEASYSVTNPTANYTDADNDKYGIDGTFRWKDGQAGMKATYYHYANTRPASNYTQAYFLLTPYFMAKFGPVGIQAEVNYANGIAKKYDNVFAGPTDVRMDNLSAFLDATATFGPVYFGGTLAYVSGDDPGSTDRQEGGTLNGGRDWQPCLIMWNFNRTYWTGALPGFADGTTTASQDTAMSNAWFFQGRAGVKPIDKLDIMASVSYANADKKPTAAWQYNDYGWEVDLTATYKITNNLSYMLGGAYMFTGNYYRANGPSAANNYTMSGVSNDYLVINKLTLTF